MVKKSKIPGQGNGRGVLSFLKSYEAAIAVICNWVDTRLHLLYKKDSTVL